MKRIGLLMVVSMCLSAGCLALEIYEDVAGRAPGLARGPVLQNVTPTSITVLGRPKDALLKSNVHVTVSPKRGRIISASGRYDAAKDTFEITVDGLQPATVCDYWVTVGSQTAGPFWFMTPPAAATATVRMAVYGDTRSQSDKHALVADAILRARPHIVLCTGDLVANGRAPEQWDPQYFGPARNLHAYVPSFPCLGNHERRGKRYFDLHALPGNESYYAIDYGCLHIVTLDQYQDCKPGSEQYRWLQANLARPRPGMWTVVQFHEPPFGVEPRRGIAVRWVEELVPLLEKHKVDVVFNGHDHHYARIQPLSEKAGGHGVVYFVTGGGGAPLHTPTEQPWAASVYGGHHFIICEASPERFGVEARTPEGKVIDRFTIERNSPPIAVCYGPYVAGVRLRAAYKTAIRYPRFDPASGKLTFDLDNPSTENVRLTLKFSLAGCAWRVGKPETAVVLDPGAKQTVSVGVRLPVADKAYPAPVVMLTAKTDFGQTLCDVKQRIPYLNRPAATVQRVASAPTLDGILDEAVWQQAEPLTLWLPDGSGRPMNPTDARVILGPDGIYVGVNCLEDKLETIRAKATKRDADAWMDDCVEVLVDATAEGKECIHCIASVTGAVYDEKKWGKWQVTKWDGKWTAKTRRHAKGWTVEFRIPWEDVGLTRVPEAGSRIGFQLARREHVPAAEGRLRGVYYQWAVTFAGNAAVGRFGKLVVK